MVTATAPKCEAPSSRDGRTDYLGALALQAKGGESLAGFYPGLKAIKRTSP